MADLYVNDAFGTAHRAHASTAGLANFLPSACGYLIKKEIDFIGGALDNPARPFVAILGGAKVSDKIGVITNLLDKADTIIIGGGMAYTFIGAQGGKIGDSLFEADKVDLAKEILAKAEEKGVKLLLPTDTVVADAFDANANSKVVPTMEIPDGWHANANSKVVPTMEIPDGWQGLDIGPETIAKFSEAIKGAKTVIWNGPAGVFEFEKFAVGTKAIAQAIADADCTSIIGGGDSAGLRSCYREARLC